MAAFFRGLLLFLFGALAGAAGILFLTPSFQVDVRRGDTAVKPLDLGSRVATSTPAPAAPAPTPTPAKAAAPAPATTVAVKHAPAASAAPTAPAAAGSSAEPTLDFAAISRHLVLWPTAVTVKKPTTVAVVVEGQKPQDLALETGAVLQLTRVLANGQLEVRAKGAKFEIASTATDFAAELGKRVTELVAKGTKFDSPYPAAAPGAAAEPAPVAPVAAAPAPVAVVPKGPLTLAQRIDVLYGRKAPEPEATPAPAAPAASPTPAPSAAAPAAVAPAVVPQPVVAPAPTSPEAAKAEEKGKDLDRKMNQLFK
jgi:2-oxoglutarate dehydrogenase E2 component (dihydrolipoamide succinyltransferase)